MINGAVHTLSPNLTQSLHNYRSHLETRQGTKETQQPEPSQPPAPSPSEPDSSQPKLGEIEAVSQEHRDTARKAAVHAFEIQNAKTSVETYIRASGNDSDDDIGTSSIDPADAYSASMKISRHEGMINSLETRQLEAVKRAPDEVAPAPTEPADASEPDSAVPQPAPEVVSAEPADGSYPESLPPSKPGEIEAVSQEYRDTARQEAVHAFEIQNVKTSVNTYAEASSGDDSDEAVETSSMDPAEAYNASMKYSRHESLISAFENASRGENGGDQVNIVI